MSKLNLCIIIPIYNEEEILHNIIKKALNFSKNLKSKIIFVNDGSTDSSKKILSKVKSKKIITITKKNEGYGKTILAGYRKALKLNAEFILQIDSDDQIPFGEFKKLLKYKNQFDFIIGKRKNRKDPISRILISICLKIVLFIMFGKYVDDAHCPLRVMKRSFLKEIIDPISFSSIPNVFISLLAKKRGSYKSVDIKHRQRYSGSQLNYFKVLKLCIFSISDICKFKFIKHD